MTPELAQKLRIRHLRRTTAFERLYVPAMHAAIRNQVAMFVKVLRSRGLDAARAETYPQNRIATVIKSIYERVGMFYARITNRQIRASVEQKAGFGINEELNENILKQLSENIFKDIQNISETTKEDILRIISQGVKEGWSIDRTAYELEHSGFPLRRARLIVRTELAKAMNAGQQAAKEESDWETNDTWLSAHDARTRHSHVQIDGARIKEGDKFPVRKRKGGFDMMTGPGDPTASAENVCNCRCTKVTRAARDSNGRLIRKRKIFVALPGDITRDRQVITI